MSTIDPSGNFSLGGIISGIGNAIGDIGSAIGGAVSTVGNAIGSAASAVGNFFAQNGALIGEIVAITAASVLTAGAVGAVLGIGSLSGLAAMGAAALSGAVAGAVAGALSFTMIGGQFSWQAVAVGALTGAVSGGISSSLGVNAGVGSKILAGAGAGGATNWLAGAVQGHPSFTSFYQGAILGGAVSAALVGVSYLMGNNESSAINGTANRSPAEYSNTTMEDSFNDLQSMNDQLAEDGAESVSQELAVGYVAAPLTFGAGPLDLVYNEGDVLATANDGLSFFSGFEQGYTGAGPLPLPEVLTASGVGFQYLGNWLGAQFNDAYAQ